MNAIKECDNLWEVDGDSGEQYVVTNETGEWFCSCPDFLWRRRLVSGHCKHIRYVLDLETRRKQGDLSVDQARFVGLK